MTRKRCKIDKTRLALWHFGRFCSRKQVPCYWNYFYAHRPPPSLQFSLSLSLSLSLAEGRILPVTSFRFRETSCLKTMIDRSGMSGHACTNASLFHSFGNAFPSNCLNTARLRGRFAGVPRNALKL